MTYKCPRCSTDLVYQPAASQYWCPKCKLYKSHSELTGTSLIDQLRAKKKTNG